MAPRLSTATLSQPRCHHTTITNDTAASATRKPVAPQRKSGGHVRRIVKSRHSASRASLAWPTKFTGSRKKAARSNHATPPAPASPPALPCPRNKLPVCCFGPAHQVGPKKPPRLEKLLSKRQPARRRDAAQQRGGQGPEHRQRGIDAAERKAEGQRSPPVGPCSSTAPGMPSARQRRRRRRHGRPARRSGRWTAQRHHRDHRQKIRQRHHKAGFADWNSPCALIICGIHKSRP